MYSFSTFFLFFVYLAAYKHADGKKIDGRRVLVDVERGRTVKGWRPRRLGKSSFDQTCFDWIKLFYMLLARRFFIHQIIV